MASLASISTARNTNVVRIFTSEIEEGVNVDSEGTVAVFKPAGDNLMDVISTELYTPSVTTSAWVPSDTTTRLWYDMSKSATVSAPGSLMNQVNNNSSASEHLVQLTGSAQPTYANNGMQLAGTEYMSVTLDTPIVGSCTMFVVCTHTLLTSGGIFDGIDGSNRKALYIRTTNSMGMYAYAKQIYDNKPIPTDITQYRCEFAGTQSGLYHNGTARTTGDVGTSTINGLKIGISNAGAKMRGTINEFILVEGVPSVETVAKFEGYFAHKWDALNEDSVLAGKLLEEHPYKTEAPVA